MNIFELMTIFAILAGAVAGYQFGSQHGAVIGLIAIVVGGAFGVVIGPLLAALFILPFHGLSCLIRWVTTGRWTDPSLKNDIDPDRQ